MIGLQSRYLYEPEFSLFTEQNNGHAVLDMHVHTHTGGTRLMTIDGDIFMKRFGRSTGQTLTNDLAVSIIGKLLSPLPYLNLAETDFINYFDN